MRSMDNTKLIDSIQLDLKSCDNVPTAINKMLSVVWMCIWVILLLLSLAKLALAFLKNVVPFIGPLHISLNARECVLLNFYQVFADLYSFLFGKKAKLAKKPKLWRISLLSEVIYGGWTLIAMWHGFVSFHKCKVIEFLTVLNPSWQLRSTSFEHLFNYLSITSMNCSASPYSTAGLCLLYSKDVTTTKHY